MQFPYYRYHRFERMIHMALLTSAPRGTQDVLPADSYKWQFVEAIASEEAKNFGYKEISDALDMPINTVKTKIRRAKAMLLKMMDYSDELL